jgi:hypothetical protein
MLWSPFAGSYNQHFNDSNFHSVCDFRASTMLLEVSMQIGQPRHIAPGGGVRDLASRRATRQQQRILLQVIFNRLAQHQLFCRFLWWP